MEELDSELIGALSAEDVSYRYHPYDEPVVGRAAVVASWLGEEEHTGAPSLDEPAPSTPSTGRSRSTVASRWRREAAPT